jgi:hypothetical protein
MKKLLNKNINLYDFSSLKDREHFFKLLKEFDEKFKNQKINYTLKSGKDPRLKFVEIDGQQVSYYDLQVEVLRELLYFIFKNETLYFSSTSFSSLLFLLNSEKEFSNNSVEPLPDIEFIKKNVGGPYHLVKLVEFATPEVSICDYKAYCDYVKKEIGLYAFEQQPRVKAVLDKRKEVVKQWSLKFREFASQYFDLSNVIEYEDYELQMILSLFNVKEIYSKKLKDSLLWELPHKFFGIDISERNDLLDNWGRTYEKFKQQHSTPGDIIEKELMLNPEGPLALHEEDEKIDKTLVDTFVFHTSSYSLDSHLFRNFFVNFPAMLIALEMGFTLLHNLDYFLEFKDRFRVEINFIFRFLNLKCETKSSYLDTKYSLLYKTNFYLAEILDKTSLVRAGFVLQKQQPNLYRSAVTPISFVNKNLVDFSFKLYLAGDEDNSLRYYYNQIIRDAKTGFIKEQGKLIFDSYNDTNRKYLRSLNFMIDEFEYFFNLNHYYLDQEVRLAEISNELCDYYKDFICSQIFSYLDEQEVFLKSEDSKAAIYVSVFQNLTVAKSSYLLKLQLRDNFVDRNADFKKDCFFAGLNVNYEQYIRIGENDNLWDTHKDLSVLYDFTYLKIPQLLKNRTLSFRKFPLLVKDKK